MNPYEGDYIPECEDFNQLYRKHDSGIWSEWGQKIPDWQVQIKFIVPEISEEAYSEFKASFFIGAGPIRAFLRYNFNICSITSFNYYLNGEKMSLYKKFSDYSQNGEPLVIVIESKD